MYYGYARCFLFFILLTGFYHAFPQKPGQLSRQEYIEKYKDAAVLEMLTYKIPASIIMAQAVLESENGNSPLAVEANNHFGIKCHTEWTGKIYLYDDDQKNECFRKYDDPLDSYRDHSEFLVSRDWYKPLFLLDVTDYKGWAYGLKQAGYATNPTYPQQLIKIIEDNRLYELDKLFDKEYEGEISVLEKKPVPTDKEIILPDHFKPLKTGPAGRMMYVNNGVRFTVAPSKDTFYRIAVDFGISISQLYKYNELKPGGILYEGQVIYIEKKKKHARKGYHTVAPGETMHSIAQEYAVRTKSLYRINKMKKGTQPAAGRKIYLKKWR
jgi:LysM repeat protein